LISIRDDVMKANVSPLLLLTSLLLDDGSMIASQDNTIVLLGFITLLSSLNVSSRDVLAKMPQSAALKV